MIESIHFRNFKALRDSDLLLGRFNLIVGPNGSGKSTILQALQGFCLGSFSPNLREVLSVGVNASEPIELVFRLSDGQDAKLIASQRVGHDLETTQTGFRSNREFRSAIEYIHRFRLYSFEADAIAQGVQLQPQIELAPNGAYLAGVLDRLRDSDPDRFEQINVELNHWIPEFDRILFETPGAGQRSILLRTSNDHHRIPATQLSQGTLIAIAILTLAYLPNPPAIVGFEEPDRGIHPRLLRDVRNALYRLSYPEEFRDTRPAIQVMATTHSPYLLDLFRDRPHEIVIANKVGDNVKFERLSDRADLHQILEDSHLGDAWYTGVLGGVPAGT